MRELRIGVIQNPKEVVVELADDADIDAVRAEVEGALGEAGKVLWLTDRRGRQVAIAGERIAYVDFGPEDGDRRIGFGG